MKRLWIDVTVMKADKKGRPVSIVQRIPASALKPRVAARLLREVADELDR